MEPQAASRLAKLLQPHPVGPLSAGLEAGCVSPAAITKYRRLGAQRTEMYVLTALEDKVQDQGGDGVHFFRGPLLGL